MLKGELISDRGFLPDDKSFIMATFLKGLYYGDSPYSAMPKSLFMENYHNVLESLFQFYVPYIRVACLKDDPTVILGYSILNSDSTILHWVFVKKAWRGIGIARSLVPGSVKVVTHLTKTGLSLIRKRDLTFNPFAI